MPFEDELLNAVRENDYKKTLNAIRQGADVTYSHQNYGYPLNIAINNNNFKITKLILETREISQENLKDMLLVAMTAKTRQIAKELIKYMNDFNLGCFNYSDSYHKSAIDNEWPDVLDLMLQRGAKFKKYNSLDVQPMHYAAKNKNPVYVEILGKALQPDFYYGEEYTPLMVAAENGNDKTMDALLSMGANPEAEQRPRVTLDFLVPSFLRTVFIMTKLNSVDSVIHKAVYSGNTKTVDVLLKHRPNLDLNKQGTDGKTPLMIAAERGDKKMVHHLLKLGVNVHLRRGEGNALHSAVDSDSVEIARLLITYGIDQNHRSNDNKTPLDKAVYEHKYDGIPHIKLINFLKDVQRNPKKITSQKPFYFSNQNPKGSCKGRE